MKIKAIINRFLYVIYMVTRLILTYLFYKYRFGNIGFKSILFGNFSSLTRPDCIFLGKNVRIFKNARMDCITSWIDSEFKPSIVIGNNVNIGQNFFVSCASKISIGDGVLISDNVAIIDNEHVYQKGKSSSETPIIASGITIEKNVVIYRNVTILKGAHIEEGVVIGANSIVKGRILKNSMAAGMCAKTIRTLS
jgi:acetyltransferase-like isoleucine patch superfamily enzyme